MKYFQQTFTKIPLGVKNTTVVASLILFLLCAYLLTENMSLRKLNENNVTLMKQQLTTISQNKKDLEDLYFLKNDMAKPGSQFTREYTFGYLGVYSPEFTGKQITFLPWEYKTALVGQRSISLDNDSHGIVVWELSGSYYSLPTLSGQESKATQYDIPTFGGYENHGTPVWVSRLLNEAKETFTTTQGIKMHLGYAYAPKSISSVEASFLIPSDVAAGRPERYVVLWQEVDNYLDATQSDITTAKNKLKAFANTITLSQPSK